MLMIYTYKNEGKINICYDDEGMEELKTQLSFAKRDEDHAFFLPDEPIGGCSHSENCMICDFINIFCDGGGKDTGSIENAEHGCSSVVLSLSNKTFDLLLESISSSNSKQGNHEIALQNANMSINLIYRK